MKLWKKIVFVVAALVVVAVACFLSWSYGFRKGMFAGGITREMAEFYTFSGYADEQATNADCQGLKETINDFLSLLEKYKGVKGGLITDTSYYGDKMMSHVRLARIEKQLGNETEAARHMELAKEACAHRKWKDCSEERMLWFTKRVEKNHPIACFANEK